MKMKCQTFWDCKNLWLRVGSNKMSFCVKSRGLTGSSLYHLRCFVTEKFHIFWNETNVSNFLDWVTLYARFPQTRLDKCWTVQDFNSNALTLIIRPEIINSQFTLTATTKKITVNTYINKCGDLDPQDELECLNCKNNTLLFYLYYYSY